MSKKSAYLSIVILIIMYILFLLSSLLPLASTVSSGFKIACYAYRPVFPTVLIIVNIIQIRENILRRKKKNEQKSVDAPDLP